MPAGLNSGTSDLAPTMYPPTIGYPTPINPGPMVTPPYGLHAPMQMQPMLKPGGP
jgi:hypothetical protein